LVTVLKIKIEPLTEEAFSPFGQIIGRKDSEPNFETRGGSTLAWKVDFACHGQTEVQYMKVDFQPTWTVELLERHQEVTQSFIPVNGKPMVFVVAPATDITDPRSAPDPEGFRAFYMDGSQGVMLHIGTWHSPNRLAVQPPDCEFIILSSIDTTEEQKQVRRTKGIPSDHKLTNFIDYKERFDTTFLPVWE
jgi:ureidoglycolate lyase